MGSKKSAMEYYASVAPGYDELHGEEQLSKLNRLSAIVDFRDGDSVLDVGCGTGLLAGALSGKVGRIVGVDLSRAMAERGRRRRCGEFLVCDAEALPFRERAFDKVISFTVAQNLENPSRMLEEVGRVCRGTAALTVLKKWRSSEKFAELAGKFLKSCVTFEFGSDIFCVGNA
ncbi:MAG: methyltransferase domain-containing protein [Candidatus Brockarchaeota archaeon]|nr:methyltransferase domain-containing protein [Candidatus Brockarchaeota archaeon]